MGKLQRDRGLNYEREVANAFKAKTRFTEAKRHLEFQAVEAEEGRDLDNTGPLAIQCKRGRQYASMTKIFEVKAQGKLAALVTRADGKESLIAMRLEDFFTILNLAYPIPPLVEPDFMN